MLKHRILLDPHTFSRKPNSSEAARISTRIVECPVEIDIIELSKQVTAPNSRTWVPAYLEGKRTDDCWLSQSLFALDFDKGFTFKDLLDRAKEYDLDSTFAYSTFSDSPTTPKFRVVWQVKEVFTDKNYRNQVQLALMELFPEADQSCKDTPRFFYGGRDLIYQKYDYFLNVNQLIEAAQFYAVRNSSSKNMSRDARKVDKRLGGDEKRSKNNTSYNNNIGAGENASESTERPQKTIRNVDFHELKKEVKILNDLMDSNKKLKHNELLGLATNLRWMENGAALFHKCIDANPDYAQNEKHKIMVYCKNRNYAVRLLSSFSPYEDDWHYGSLLNAARKKQVVRLNKYVGEKMEDIRKKLKDIFKQIQNTKDNNVHLVIAPTGVGKTELYTRLENGVVALPNHSLVQEVSEQRMKVVHKRTPSFEKLPRDVRETLNYYYSIGAISWANHYLADLAKTDKLVKEYRDACFSCYASQSTILTTHQKASHIDWFPDTIIYDEDILSTLLPIGKVLMNDLVRLEACVESKNDKKTLGRLIDDIREGKVNSPRKTDLYVFENFRAIEDEVLGSKYKYNSDVLHFFASNYFVVDAKDIATIHYIRKYEPPLNKKVIILSATANKQLWRVLLGDRLRVYDLSNVEPVGMIKQDLKYSYSRSYFLNHLDYVVKKVGSLPVITFAEFKTMFTNSISDLHFGKSTGSNAYEGEDIAVVGTPHVSPIAIVLYACALGLSVQTHEFGKTCQQPVTHNGFRFWFNTYDNESLRAIQFYFIESELRQAIGRARANTTPAKVSVFSNYPLPEACVTEEERELGEQELEKRRKAYLEQCFNTHHAISEHESISFGNPVTRGTFCPEEFDEAKM